MVTQGAKGGATGMPNDTFRAPELTPSASDIIVNCETCDIATSCGPQLPAQIAAKKFAKKTSKKQQAKVKAQAALATP